MAFDTNIYALETSYDSRSSAMWILLLSMCVRTEYAHFKSLNFGADVAAVPTTLGAPAVFVAPFDRVQPLSRPPPWSVASSTSVCLSPLHHSRLPYCATLSGFHLPSSSLPINRPMGGTLSRPTNQLSNSLDPAAEPNQTIIQNHNQPAARNRRRERRAHRRYDTPLTAHPALQEG